MLDHLFVKNFQSHNETLVHFVPGVNAIIGDPNSGKSALLRALQWVATNRPLGDSFIRRGEDEGRVQLVLQRNGQITAVTRVRGKASNFYFLVDGSRDASYTAFGNSPPDEVLEALNFSELNYQSQLSPYFLVFESPGAIAQYIRVATGLEDVKEVLDILSRHHRQMQGTLRDRQADLEEVETSLQAINRVDTAQLESLILLAEKIGIEKDEYAQKIQNLRILTSQLQEVQSTRIVLPEARLKAISEEVISLSSDFSQISAELSAISSVVHDLIEIQHRQILLPDTLDDLFEHRQSLETEYNSLQSQIVELGGIVSNLIDMRKEKDKLAASIQEYEKEVLQLKNQLSVCPACGSILTDETKKNLLDNSR